MGKKIKRWAVADCETDAFDGREISPFVWGFIDSDGERKIFWNTAEFVEHVQAFEGMVYAHNGGRFDWLQAGVVEHLENGEVKIINSRLASAKLGQAELRDSFLCLPAALEKFGAKMTFDYEILKRERAKDRYGKNRQKIEQYLMQDCVALFDMMEVFIDRFGFSLTQAGAALKTWENMGGEKRRYSVAHDEKFRPFYFGGRCEVFEYGAPLRGKFKLFDVVSMYPAGMVDIHPAGTDYYMSTDYKNSPGWTFWTVDATSAGAFPVRDKHGITFPRGRNTYHVTGWELQAALETGTVTIHAARGWIPRRTETLKPYVEKFYAEKKAADESGDIVGRTISKIFLNSLYGKYAANPAGYFDYQIIDAGRLWAKDDAGAWVYPGWEMHAMIGESDIIRRQAKNPQYFDVALAASITGWARARLWRAVCASGRPIYCDTDSLLCEDLGCPEGSELGDWKLEHDDICAAHIAGKKLYALELKTGKYKTAHKGVSSLDIEVEDIKRICAGEVVEIFRSAPSFKINGAQSFIDRKLRKT